LFIAATGFGSLAYRQQAPIPPLPKVVTSGFPVRVRAQMDVAVRDAAMHPDAADGTGRRQPRAHQ